MNILETLGLFSAVAGSIALLDLFLKEDRKSVIAEYVFGFKDVSFASFETSVIRNLMSFVMNGDDLSLRKIFLRYSLGVGVPIVLFSLTAVYLTTPDLLSSFRPSDLQEVQGPFLLLMNCIAILVGIVMYDICSLIITKMIFVNHGPVFPLSGLAIILDLAVSLAPHIIILGWPLLTGGDTTTLYTLIFIITGLTSVAVSIAQIIILTAGTLARAVGLLTRLNQLAAIHTEIYRHPFAYIGIITGTLTVALTALA